ncbi:MAG: hypothetical protein ACYC3X_11810 [Pirellulaceae bacterium]
MTVNLVATINVGEVWYADYSIPHMRAYAARVGADFLEFRFFEKRAEFGRFEAWLKLEAMRFLAAQSRYGAMLLLDADQLIMPSCPNLFAGEDERMAVVQDMGMPEVDGRFRDWCERNHGFTPHAGPYFNVGMLYIPVSAAREWVANLQGPFVDDGYPEQDYLNLVAQRHGHALRWLPHEYNWLAPQLFDSAIRQHVVHFVGTYKQMLPSFLSKLFAHLSHPSPQGS